MALVGHADHLQHLQLRFLDVLQRVPHADLGLVLALEDIEQKLAIGVDDEDAISFDLGVGIAGEDVDRVGLGDCGIEE